MLNALRNQHYYIDEMFANLGLGGKKFIRITHIPEDTLDLM